MSASLLCPGCRARFKTDRILSRHTTDCPALSARLHAVGHKRKAKKTLDRARKKQQKSQEEEWGGIELEQNEWDNLTRLRTPSPPRVPTPPPPPDPAHVSRAGRVRRPPRHFNDFQPTTLAGLPAHLRPPSPPPRQPSPPHPASSTIEYETEPDIRQEQTTPEPESANGFCSELNAFGIYREYYSQPQHDPEEYKTIADLLDPDAFPDAAPSTEGRGPSVAFSIAENDDIGHGQPDPSSPNAQASSSPSLLPPSHHVSSLTSPSPVYAPMNNISEFRLLQWQYAHPASSSNQAINALVKDVIQAPDFEPSHFPDGFTIEAAQARMERWQPSQTHEREPSTVPLPLKRGWRQTSVAFRVPKEGCHLASEADAPLYTVDNVLVRSLLDAFVESCTSPNAVHYHWISHKTFWRQDATANSDDSTGERVCRRIRDTRIYTDIFNSDAMIECDAAIRARPREPDDPPDLEYAAGPIMLYSDSTHLANFGTASLWPIYMYNGSESKYSRARPSSFSAQHIAYVPSLPDSFTDWYVQECGDTPRPEMLTFCRRELYQAVMLLLLDDRFMYAYAHGHVVECGDQIRRRMFPRFFIHSADYVEKILATCLKYFAKCPCPRCLIEKDHLPDMGTRADHFRRRKTRTDNAYIQGRIKLARKWLFEDGVPLTSVWLKRILDPLSLTPTRPALSAKLSDYGLDVYSLYVPDLLHEFELGVWKNTLTHLVRILHSMGGGKVQVFNERFRKIPTFGRSTIRRFVDNMADLKKMAARDFEDALQCSHAVFAKISDDEEDNEVILDLIFDYQCWHCLAKLRLHTDDTLELLEVVTVHVGQSVRRFMRTTCAKYVTYELPKESAARGRRRAALAKKGQAAPPTSSRAKTSGRRIKQFTMKTYKYHALRDYVSAIRRFGPSDNWTTQTGELEHRHVKRFYARTNKHNYARQIARHVQIGQNIRTMASQIRKTTPRDVETGQDRAYDDLSAWVSDHRNDPAFKSFLPLLYDHLLARLSGKVYEGEEPECSVAERSSLRILANRIYHHRTLRVNYTTYDMRRSQDVIKPSSHPDVMVLSHEDGADENTHPYWYARVIHIFHLNVSRIDPVSRISTVPRRMDVLWVRWFGLDPTAKWGFKAKRHPRVGFVPYDEGGLPFGFLDPQVVLRGCHIMPIDGYERTPGLLPPSIARQGQNAYEKREHHDTDYQYYYVNMCVDRDMFMRYLGGGVGHKGMGHNTQTSIDSDDGESDWEDVDPEVAALLGDANTSGSSSDPEADLLRLVNDLGDVAQTGSRTEENEQATDDNEADLPEDDDDAEEAQDDDEDDNDTPLDARGEHGSDDESEDEYGAEGYATLS
ncbi:hypothetical protein C8Q76DRAFT_420457 [Earliella scabrosa]|nr:hypothetical protein C8Q76DRAFT_420457 [Earliella scabrosa]